MFWQNKDDSLAGYKTKEAIDRDSGGSLVMLKGRLIHKGAADQSGFCNAAGDLSIQRIEAESVGSGPCTTFRPLLSSKPLTLLNILHAPPKSKLARVAAVFSQIESAGYILAWTIAKDGDEVSVDLVELPRLRLSFVSGLVDGKPRFLCQEHAGLFIAGHRCGHTKRLLAGLTCALLLSNSTKEYFVLMNAAVKPLRPNQVAKFPSALLLDRRDKKWISNLPVPHYLFQIHISRRFFIMPSLASMLYMLLLRFHAREYAGIFKIVNSCVSDVELTKEEKQVYTLQALRFPFLSPNQGLTLDSCRSGTCSSGPDLTTILMLLHAALKFLL